MKSINKLIILVAIILPSCNLKAQKFYDSRHNVVISKAEAEFYILTDTSQNSISERMFLVNDTLIEITHFTLTSEKLRDGKNYRFYNSGKLKYDIDYKQGKLNGIVKGYYENGTLKRNDVYNNDRLVEGSCYGLDGKDTTYYIFERQASYQGGGLLEFRNFINKTVKYPRQAVSRNIQGKVIVQFSVNSKGIVCDIKVIDSPDILLSNSAIEAVMASDIWEPAVQEGRKVKQQFIFPIIYSLE